MALTREDVDILRKIVGEEIGKVREDVQKVNERFEWMDLRFSTLREVTSARPTVQSRQRYKATRDAMPSPYGCNDKGWVDYEPF